MEKTMEEFESPIQKICPWARKHMAAEVRLRVEQNLRTARKEEAERQAKHDWIQGIVMRRLNKPGGIEGAIKMAEESVACAYAAWAMLKRTDASAFTPQMVSRLGELEFLANHASSALNGIKNAIALEKWML